ncbi:MAG: enoyl-CoA hydratase/isomerase family protein [Chloroflexi bacterium]|nr:enoyl-CoA hydratase/isomerase family protein [Chloroflexota bacterium]
MVNKVERGMYYDPRGHFLWDPELDKSKHHIIFKKDKQKRRADIILNRPDKLNALERADRWEMLRLMDEIEADDDIKVVVIRGEGPCFSTGAHAGNVGFVHGIQQGTAGQRRAPERTRLAADRFIFQTFYERWLNLLKPTVAQVHSYALGFGMWLTLASDITIASDDAVFGHPAYRWAGGAVDGLIALWFETIGLKRAKKMLLTGKYIEAQEAYEAGLVSEVVSRDKLDERVDQYCRAIALEPLDGLVDTKVSFEAAHTALGIRNGITAGYIMHSLNSNLRFEADEWSYFRDRRDRGLKDAMAERDQRYADLPGFGFPFRAHDKSTTRTHTAAKPYKTFDPSKVPSEGSGGPAKKGLAP